MGDRKGERAERLPLHSEHRQSLAQDINQKGILGFAENSCQRFYVVDVEGYIYLVPFVREGHTIFLKTIFPSRKHTKQYLEQISKHRGKEHE